MAGETILIADENRDTVAELADILTSRGYDVLSAHNGRQGLWLALEREPDLILLDWDLSQPSGYKVLQSLREQGDNTPVVLLTMHGSENVAVQAFRLGVRDYISKPFHVPDTLETIEQALAEERLRREKEEIARQLEQANRQLEHQLLEMTTLQAIGESLTSTLDMEKVLAGVVEAACYLSNARESSLLLLEQDEDVLITRAYHSVERQDPARVRFQYSTSPLRQAIETGEPLFLTSETTDSSIKLRTGYMVRSLLYVPLHIHDRPIGLLGVTDKVGGPAFLPDDAFLLTSLASYAVVAIENARLYQSEGKLARAETVKQMIVTLSHYIKNPLTAISLSTYELSTKHQKGQISCKDDLLRHSLQMIEMNIKEIAAVIAVLQQLADPQATTYIDGIQMIDIEQEVRAQVQKIRMEYPEIDRLLGTEPLTD